MSNDELTYLKERIEKLDEKITDTYGAVKEIQGSLRTTQPIGVHSLCQEHSKSIDRFEKTNRMVWIAYGAVIALQFIATFFLRK